MEQTDNLNILRFKPLITPDELRSQLPETDQVARLVAGSRVSIHNILTNKDPRRLVITGPCSLHDRRATLEYPKAARFQYQYGRALLLSRVVPEARKWLTRAATGGYDAAKELLKSAK